LRTTDRLVLRPFRDEDLPSWAELNADPQVMEFLGPPLTRERSDDIAASANRRYETEGIGFLAIERRSDGALLGTAGLQREPWYPDDLELGWRLARKYWGNGYATEAARSWLDYAFADLELPRVISITDTPNTRSIAVMTRLGMTLDHKAQLEEDGETFDAVIYSITCDTWRLS
jgi:RimJ/RimL family protein N-acetyltransferase